MDRKGKEESRNVKVTKNEVVRGEGMGKKGREESPSKREREADDYV